MNKVKGIMWGLVLIALGIIFSLNALKIVDIDLFFDGWWTLFLIVPSIIGLVTDNDKGGNIFTLVLGIILLLACQDIIEFDLVWKLIVPIIVIIIGLSLIFKNVFSKEQTKINASESTVTVFSGEELKYNKEEFKGKTLTAVFGGIDLDLTDAIIKEDVTINATAVFGGIEIKFPDNVNIKVKSNSIFGGVESKKTDIKEKNKTIYVNATCIFGGVDIK